MKPYESSASKREQIRQMFNNIAPKYDMLNHLLSLGIDRCWRNRVVRILKADEATNILDVATGTGDLAIAMARKLDNATIVGADLSEQMVDVARAKVEKLGIGERLSLQVADVEHMPFNDLAFDAVTVAFGVRNFQNIPASLQEIRRVTTDGGRLVILEFSTPTNKIFGSLYRFYFHRVLPIVGGWLSKDRKAYTYLPQSVDEFPSPARFLELMAQAGYTSCRSESLFFGVAQIYIGINSSNK